MTPSTLFILADDFEGYGKLIGIVIFGVIWGIGALSSVMKKANEQAKRNAAMRPASSSPPGQQVLPAAAALRQSTMRSQNVAATTRRLQDAFPPTAAQRAEAARRKSKASRPAPPPLPQAAKPALPARSAMTSGNAAATALSTPPASSAHLVRSGGANAGALRRWLRPETMRKQFILTELLQPPMALREERKTL